MDLVYIYGAPGTGKLTVARQLEAMLGYKLWHNHVSIDAVLPIFDFDTEPFWRQVHLLRQNMLEEAARSGVSILYTSAFAYPTDLPIVQKRLPGIEAAGGTIRPVLLTCDREVLRLRAVGEDRVAMGKLSSLEVLDQVLAKHDFKHVIPGYDSLIIDNTYTSPADVAQRIIDHYGLTPVRSVGGGLR